MEQYRLFNVREVERLQQGVTDLLRVISKSRGALKEETAWLIEWPATADSQPRWWHPGHGWTIDASRATRFVRQEDAQAFIEAGRFCAGMVATEHKWIGVPVCTDAG